VLSLRPDAAQQNCDKCYAFWLMTDTKANLSLGRWMNLEPKRRLSGGVNFKLSPSCRNVGSFNSLLYGWKNASD
jgi:hypothetical protein